MLRTIIGSLCGFVLVVNLAGCGGETIKGRPPLYKVSGTVKYKGEPVKGAMVNFGAKVLKDGGRPATGFTDDSGTYQLTTFDTNDGAPEGEMVVSISKSEVAGGPAAKPMTPEDYQKKMASGTAGGPAGFTPPVAAENKLPAKYADPKTSGLARTIEKKDNSFNFDLTD